MNPSVMKDAKGAWGVIARADREKGRQKLRALPSQLRAMGLVATLEWLEAKRSEGSAALETALLGHLGLKNRAEVEGQLSTVRFLELSRRAHAFAEALHLLDRAAKGAEKDEER